MNLIDRVKSKNSVRDVIVIAIATALFFALIFTVFQKNDSINCLGHSGYDSYTLQALAWRKGEVKLDKNYPWLELAIINEEYFAEHDKDDYEAYREFFGDVGVTIDDREGNEYYVSFPPVPSVTMFFLSFIFGEKTPSGIVSATYTMIAFMFAILLVKRLGHDVYTSVFVATIGIVASSALFLSCNKSAGGVWFQAQTMSLMFTVIALYLAYGEKDVDLYLSFAMLALAVGCRPFQIIYFFMLAYLAAKKYKFKILKTAKFYIAPALIGGSYMVYNYVRFGNPLEFGHNYLPEFMRVPDGQFGFNYFAQNFKTAVLDLPKIVNGKLEYSQFGFAFYVSNVIFIALGVLVLSLIVSSVYRMITKSGKIDTVRSSEALFLIALMMLHLFALMLHKTWGGWQFGSRYVVDVVPACIAAVALLLKGIDGTDNFPAVQKRLNVSLKAATYVLLAGVLVFGLFVNVTGTMEMF